MSNFYVSKRLLVTGACGFIGAHLIRHLLANYDDIDFIVTYDKITNCSKPTPFVGCPEQYKFPKKHLLVQGDICDEQKVLETLKQYKIDTIVHLAAETHVDDSFQNSFKFTKTNIMGTHILLQCTLELKDQIKRFIHVSTDEVYGETSGGEAFTETSTLNPTNPYAASKVGAEALVNSYRISYDLPCIITRGNNVFGKEQYFDKVIPKFICRLLRGLPVEIHGLGDAKRSFLYVKDTVRALDIIMRKGTVGKIYNIGTNRETTILDLAKWLLNYIKTECPELFLPNPAESSQDKSPDPKITFVKDRFFNDKRYFINSQALHDLGWKPTVTLEEGLVKTAKWYNENMAKLWWWDRQIDKALDAHPQF